jgi:diguanylate cyclase (GGDEF)-like protein
MIKNNSETLKMLVYDEICVNTDSFTVIYEGRVVPLYPQEYRLLLLFLANPNRVLSYDAIIDSVWYREDIPTQSTVRSHIKGLRKAFKKAGMTSPFIETVHRLGYRLRPPNQSSEQITNGQQLQLKAFGLENLNLIMIDALTGVNSYFAIFNLSRQEFRRVKRYDSSFSVLMIDLDQYKLINDTYGQDMVNEAIKFTAKTIVNCLRQVDQVGRLDNQFVVILPATPLEGASRVVKRIRSAFASQPLTIQDQSLEIGVSIGIATYQDHDGQFEDILRRARFALYQDKKLNFPPFQREEKSNFIS